MFCFWETHSIAQAGTGSAGGAEMGSWTMGRVGEGPRKAGQGQSGLAVSQGTDTLCGK